MKAAECLCKIDKLGRMVLPKIIRDKFDLSEGDSLEVFTEDNKIILKKYKPCCIFCGEADNVTTFAGKNVCKSCIEKLKN